MTESPVVLLLSGPNLDLLGKRQPEIYGSATLDDVVATARGCATEHGLTLEHVQSNHEGDLVEAVHGARERCAALIVNAAALTHYGRSLQDALLAYDGPIVELHLTNPHTREDWRHESVITPVATGVISGFGKFGYELAVLAVADLIAGGAPR